MPAALSVLLDVQEADSRIDQLQHQRAALPERRDVADFEARIVAIESALVPLEEQVTELTRQQRRLEDEVTTIESRVESETRKLYSGTITVPRELSAIQDELDGLGRRQRHLEDQELELMEAIEPLAKEADGLRYERNAIESQATAARRALTVAEAEIDAQIDAVRGERGGLVADLPAELLSTYERLRTRLGGVAVAKLDGAQCTGCHLALNAVELDAVRRAPADIVLTHEECGRILIRD